MTNPLAGHFRQPGVHQKLPSCGHYYAEGDIKLSMSNEIAVYPMSGSDEILLKNPDGLLNGDSIEKLLTSCVPDIKNVREIPNPDVDVLLLAIKLCSSGDELEVTAKCPKCGHENEFGMSIRALLEQVTPIIGQNEVRLNDNLVAYLRPYTFESNTKLSLSTFEESKIYQSLFNPEVSDQERMKQFNRSFEKIAHLNLDLLAECVLKVVTTNEKGEAVEVTDQAYIKEFVANTDKQTIKKLQDAMKLFNEGGLPKNMPAFCDGTIKGDDGEETPCGHEWETEFNFDPSHFFD